jgi:hypothetical protein
LGMTGLDVTDQVVERGKRVVHFVNHRLT